jgi:hypothetical protein
MQNAELTDCCKSASAYSYHSALKDKAVTERKPVLQNVAYFWNSAQCSSFDTAVTEHVTYSALYLQLVAGCSLHAVQPLAKVSSHSVLSFTIATEIRHTPIYPMAPDLLDTLYLNQY